MLVIKTVHGSLTLGQYVAAWRTVKETPFGQMFKRSLCGHGPAAREEILREFDEGLQDRINRHIPGFGKGRKWDHNWQRECIYSARLLNTPRLIIDWLPPWLAQRCNHRLRSAMAA